MAEKSDNPLDLSNAIVSRKEVAEEIEEEVLPLSKAMKQALARRRPRSPGFLQIPAQIMARLELYGVSLPAWGVLCVLQTLEYRADKKGEPLKLTNKALEIFGVSRWVKLRALDELVAPRVHPSIHQKPQRQSAS